MLYPKACAFLKSNTSPPARLVAPVGRTAIALTMGCAIFENGRFAKVNRTR